MASQSEHENRVLSAILAGRKDLLEESLRRLSSENFADRTAKTLYRVIERYYEQTNGNVLAYHHLDDIFRNGSSGQVVALKSAYQRLIENSVSDDEFHWSVEQLRQIAAENKTGEVLAEAANILRKGAEVNGENVQGHEAAREYLYESLTSIDRDVVMQDAPEGAVQNEFSEILAEYADRKKEREAGHLTGINFGIPELDSRIRGIQPGELVICAGYSSDGKSSLAVQAAWNAAVNQKKNVVFFTTETSRVVTRRKLISRHSTLEKFGLPKGLNSADLKAGALSPAEEAKYPLIVQDLTTNKDYGIIYVAQVPRATSITSLEQKLYRLQKQFNVDFVVMDYLALLVPERGRGTTREELADTMKEAKKVATTFDNGRGVAFLSPWQISRQAREDAEKVGYYSSRALSETSESTNTADIIVSVLREMGDVSRISQIGMQILKNRDGEIANTIRVDVDYATSKFSSVSVSALSSASGDNFSSFLD